jgi:hypothetical protein
MLSLWHNNLSQRPSGQYVKSKIISVKPKTITYQCFVFALQEFYKGILTAKFQTFDGRNILFTINQLFAAGNSFFFRGLLI